MANYPNIQIRLLLGKKGQKNWRLLCNFCAPYSCDIEYLVPCHYCDALVNWIIHKDCASIPRKTDAIRPDEAEQV